MREMATLDEFRLALRRHGLGRRLKDILRTARPGLAVTCTRVEQEAIPLGGSRLGGRPDLPPDVPWPTWANAPQVFVAQLGLADLDGEAAAERLPPEGWLCLFWTPREQEWGYEAAPRDSWSILYVGPGEELERRPTPELVVPERGRRPGDPYRWLPEGMLHPCALSWRPITTFPPPDAATFETLRLSDHEEDGYFEALEAVSHRGHQILGYPDWMEDPAPLRCRVLRAGNFTGDPESCWERPEVLGEGRRRGNWQFLLQWVSEPAAGLVLGVGGDELPLHYWLPIDVFHQDALRERWTLLQCR